MTPITNDALLCATNDGRFYDRFCIAAMKDRKDNYINDSTPAVVWCRLAGSFLPTFYRTTDQRMTVTTHLEFARELAEYYREHLNEWTVEERLEFCKRKFIA